VRLHASHGGVVAVTLAFKAPFAVRSAHSSYSYSIETPQACEPHKLINGKVVAIQRGGTSEVLQRDVRRGETITWHIPDPFGVDCGRHSITLRVTYNGGDVGAPALFGRHPGGYVVVGTATLDAPSGVHPK
jgi:hypothetical protein